MLLGYFGHFSLVKGRAKIFEISNSKTHREGVGRKKIRHVIKGRAKSFELSIILDSLGAKSYVLTK